MFYRVYQSVIDIVIDHSKSFITEYSSQEVMGLLIGIEKKSEILITKAIRVTEGTETEVQFNSDHMKYFTDLKCKLETYEFIVGWYHSHPGYGLFLSATDILTHLQSFYGIYPLSVAMVIDPYDCSVGLFTIIEQNSSWTYKYLIFEQI